MSGLPTHRLARITSLSTSDPAMAHFVRRLVEQGYRVAMVARFEAVMKCLAAELPQTRTYRYHIGQPAQVKARFAMIESDWAGRRAVRNYRSGFLRSECSSTMPAKGYGAKQVR